METINIPLSHTMKAKEKLESLLLDGLQSESREMRDAEWEEIRREGLEQLRAGSSA